MLAKGVGLTTGGSGRAKPAAKKRAWQKGCGGFGVCSGFFPGVWE